MKKTTALSEWKIPDHFIASNQANYELARFAMLTPDFFLAGVSLESAQENSPLSSVSL